MKIVDDLLLTYHHILKCNVSTAALRRFHVWSPRHVEVPNKGQRTPLTMLANNCIVQAASTTSLTRPRVVARHSSKEITSSIAQIVECMMKSREADAQQRTPAF
jgi:hypothetical protein